MSSLQETLDRMSVPGDLYEVLDESEKKIRCYACGHRCLIRDGGRGVCKVRFNINGVLRVPHGYVGALQIDPIEKKPFNHLDPGANVMSFGMLGCDLHCSYCFVPNTPVVTNRGVVPISELFDSAPDKQMHQNALVGFPQGLHAVAGSGQFRQVTKAFKHSYQGPIMVIKPYYLPELRCTNDHRVYATLDVGSPPLPVHAKYLTTAHLLAIPRRLNTPFLSSVHKLIHAKDYYLLPIGSIESESYGGDVYNLEVEHEHNYLANFLLVSNCQNWEISQHGRDKGAGRDPLVTTAHDLVKLGKARRVRGIASTYNEPLITSEWAVSIFKEARQAGLRTMFISNGNGTPEVIDYLRPHLDGYKIDLKTMQDRTYRQLGGVLQHILDTIRLVKEAGLWLEIVTLVIPGFNDSKEELWDAARYIRSVSPDIPWHVTAFHPDYRMTDPSRTTSAMLIRAAEIGAEAGLNYVYAGNLPGQVEDWEHTHCPQCRTALIKRYGYHVMENRLTKTGGKCPTCGTQIPGVWA